jgi:hypothetical protein
MSERTALHEAAHALVAEELGFRPTRIELTQHGGGMCYFDDSTAVSALPRLRRELVVLLASHVASTSTLVATSPCFRRLPSSLLSVRRERIVGRRWLISTRTS